MTTTLEMTNEILETAHSKEMSKLAQEPVTARLYENGDLTLFGSEIACLRIANKNKHKETKVDYSTNLKTWFVAIYK